MSGGFAEAYKHTDACADRQGMRSAVRPGALNLTNACPLVCSCFCARREAVQHNPYCVIWLKNNLPARPMFVSKQNIGSQHCKATGGLLLLQRSARSPHAAVPPAGSAMNISTAWRPIEQHLQGGTQTQRTCVVEDSNNPLWGEQLEPYHVTGSETVLRLQVGNEDLADRISFTCQQI